MIWPFGSRTGSFRSLAAGDGAACAKLHQTGFAHSWSAAEFENLLGSSSVQGEAAFSNRSMSGFVLSRRAGDEAEILTLVVHPSLRRRGIGLELMKSHLGRLGALGARAVLLEVDHANGAACALYASLGFEQVGVRPAYYRLGQGERSSALVMRCAL